jgi:SRSO17 transposase
MTKEITFPGINDYMAPFFPHFQRSEGRELARCYVVGLMMEGERKSVEPMSGKVNASERSMQRLLTDVKWDEEGVIQEYRRTLLAETSDPQGVLVVDDTGFPKKGMESVCVGRQYCGATGKIDNCQIGVSLTYVGRDVAWPYTMDLFVPESWDNPEDAQVAFRRHKTRMPDTVHHKPKWRMALEQIDLATANGVPHRAVVADSWYGEIPEFRQGLADRGKSFVVGVYSKTEVFLESPVIEIAPPGGKIGRPRKRPKVVKVSPEPVKVSQLGEKIEEGTWEHLELRQDCKGKPLIVEAVSLRVWPAVGYKKGHIHEQVWLIIERRKKGKCNFELRYFFSNLPQEHPTIEMVRLFHERYWIEQGYQQLKEELGLDHHEGRSWIGWRRHVLLVFIAYGYLTHLRLLQKKQKSLESRRAWLRARRKLEREFFV